MKSLVNILLKLKEKGSKHPPFSTLGMNITINIVNITKTPLYFQSRRKKQDYPKISSPVMLTSVNYPGVGQAVNVNNILC
jgi:hypothetical protein